MRTTPETWNGVSEELQTEAARTEADRNGTGARGGQPSKLEDRLSGTLPTRGLTDSGPVIALFCFE